MTTNHKIDETDKTDETYINVEEMIKTTLKNIYQIQLNNDNLIIKHVGKSSEIPDIIIKENFGNNKNLNLYSCIYSTNEFDIMKTTNNKDNFLPIIKLIEKGETENNIYSICVKLNTDIKFNEIITEFDIYLTFITKNYVNNILIEKNINSENIIEIMFQKILECGVCLN
jgi:hypothetical protein